MANYVCTLSILCSLQPTRFWFPRIKQRFLKHYNANLSFRQFINSHLIAHLKYYYFRLYLMWNSMRPMKKYGRI